MGGIFVVNIEKVRQFFYYYLTVFLCLLSFVFEGSQRRKFRAGKGNEGEAVKIVDTCATSTKQCEAITNVAIRVMRLKRDGGRTKQDRLRDNIIPVLYCKYSTGIIFDYSNIVYGRYYLTCQKWVVVY